MRKLLKALFLFCTTSLLSGAELAATKDDTEKAVANHVIDSPDGHGRIRLLPVENLRKVEDVCTAHAGLLFTSGSLTPYIAYASEMGNLANIGSWSGSSKYALLFTGLHHDQEMALIYPEGDALKGKPIDIGPIFEHGGKVLPWDGSGALSHDAIIEINPGKGDSFTALLWRTAHGKGVLIPFTVSIKNPERPTELSFEFGEPRWRDPQGAYPLPTLEQLGFK